MEKKTEKKMEKNNFDFELIISIIGRGHADYIIDATREAGATGGTIIHGRGTVDKISDSSFMGISIQPEKDIVLTLVKSTLKKNVMKAISENLNLTGKEGHGITFSLPVTHAVGVRELKKDNFIKRQLKDD